MPFTEVQIDTEIDTNITTNGIGDITGSILNGVLKDMATATFQNSNTIILEMFGAVGDGITDDSAAWIDAWNYIQNQTGGIIEGLPGKTYRILTTSTTGGVLNYVTGIVHASLKNISILCDQVFSGTETGYLTVFQGCDSIIFENITLTCQIDSDGATRPFRGLNVFTFNQSCRRIIARNIKATGGRILFWNVGDYPAGTGYSSFLEYDNIETSQIAYPIVVAYAGTNIRVKNYTADNSNRSLFLYNCISVDCDIISTNSYDDDIILVCHHLSAGGPFITERVHINYVSPGRSIGGGQSCIVVVMRSDGSGGAILRNAEFNFEVDMPSNSNIQLLSIIRQTDSGGSEVGNPARGHVIDNLRIGGTCNVGNSAIILLFQQWPVGELVNNIKFRDFHATIGPTGGGFYIDTTPLIGALSFEDVTVDGDNGGRFFSGTPTGEIHWRGYKDSLVDWAIRDDVAVGGSYVTRFQSDSNGVVIPIYTTSTLPAASLTQLAYISNPAAGKSNLVVSSGSSWKYPDGTAV